LQAEKSAKALDKAKNAVDTCSESIENLKTRLAEIESTLDNDRRDIQAETTMILARLDSQGGIINALQEQATEAHESSRRTLDLEIPTSLLAGQDPGMAMDQQVSAEAEIHDSATDCGSMISHNANQIVAKGVLIIHRLRTGLAYYYRGMVLDKFFNIILIVVDLWRRWTEYLKSAKDERRLQIIASFQTVLSNFHLLSTWYDAQRFSLKHIFLMVCLAIIFSLIYMFLDWVSRTHVGFLFGSGILYERDWGDEDELLS